MLKFLRKKKNLKIGLWILVIAVIATFVFSFGPAGLMQSKNRYPKYAGEIYGKKVTTKRYLENRNQVYHQALLTYGSNLPKVIEYLKLDQQAWDRLILLKAAEDKNIRVSDKEVTEKIRNMAVFQEDGEFNVNRYKTLINRVFNTDCRSFEEEMRKNIKLQKLYQNITEDVKLADEQLKNMYKEENEEVKVSYILIEPDKFKEQVIVEEEKLEKFYEDNKSFFKMPPQVNLVYLPITTEVTKDEVTVEEEEIKNYYKYNKEFFKQENQTEENKETQYKPYEQVREDIQKTLIQGKSKDKALDIAIEIHRQVEEGIDLEKIKKDYNIPVKESGFFSKEQSIPDIGWSYDFVNAAFNLKPNQVSEIVELSKGYYILKLKGKKDAFIPQYSQIKEKVKQAYIQNEAFSLAREKANFYHKEIKNKINEGASFKKAAENLNLEVAETDFFNRYDYIKGIGQSQGFKEAAFSNKEGNLSKVVKVSKGYCLLKADEYKPINEKKFEEIKEEYRLKAAEKKKMQIFSNWFANLRKEAKIKSYL